MKRHELALPWPGVSARLGAFGLQGEGVESRLSPAMRRVHQSRCARALAIDLLAEQGVQVASIPKGPVGQPIWPEAFVGSLAHIEGYAVAAVAPRSACLSLGIDVESDLPLPQDADAHVLLEEERAWVASVQSIEPAAGRLIFCAKECVYKTVHPLRGAWLDFPDVSVEIDLASWRFTVMPRSVAARAAMADLRGEGVIARVAGQRVVILAMFAA